MPVTIDGTSGITSPAIDLTTTPLAVADGGTGLTTGEHMFRNRIINGAMNIWQRGTSFTNTANTFQYTADRWGVFSGVGIPATVSQVSSGLQNTPLALRVQRPAGNSSTSNTLAAQVIETVNCRDLSGQSVTVSFWARAGANYSPSANALGVWLRTGSGTDQGLQADINATWTNSASSQQNVTLTTSMTQYTLTFSVPSGTNEVGLWFITFPTGTAGAADFFDITGVQLEKGSTATSFDYRPYGTELQLCQRYFQVFGNISGNGSTGGFNPIGQGQGVTTNSAGQYSIFLPVSMRTVPSIGISTTASAFSVTSPTDGNTACTSLPVANIGGTNVIRVAAFCTTAGFMTAGAGNILFANSSTPAWISASAEL